MAMAKKLPTRDLEGLIAFMKSNSSKAIVLTGAGVSVSSGIPDFRSPGGMYDTLKPELLTASKEERLLMSLDPTFVVSWDVFQKNSLPYLEVRRPFILGISEQQWKASPTHWFLRLLDDKGLLRRVYTQNIDGLDYQVGIPQEKIIPVHGSLARMMCEGCGESYPVEDFQKKLRSNIKDIYKIDPSAPSESTPIPCLKCKAPLVKPATVLYGRSLPAAFFEAVEADFRSSKESPDLIFVLGTSLTVYPANSLVSLPPPGCVRVLMNREMVGEDLGMGKGENDVFISGDCDQAILKLVEGLGWEKELQSLIPKFESQENPKKE